MKYPKLVKNSGNPFQIPDLKRRVLANIFSDIFFLDYKMNREIKLSDYLISEKDFKLDSKTLGRGACGVVKSGTYLKTGEKVAIKFFLRDPEEDKIKRQQEIINEILILCSYNIETIVNFIGFKFQDENAIMDSEPDFKKAVIVTEFVPNGSLQNINEKYLKNPTSVPGYGPTQRSKIIYGIAKTMEFFHNHKIMHRDLKPENVLLTENFEPKLADFGLAKQYDPLINQTFQGGSPLFIAPEVFNFEGDNHYDLKVDVYSYGVILYFIFVSFNNGNLQLDDGRPIRSNGTWLFRIMKGQRFKKKDCIPKIYWELITKCWDQQPEKRPSFSEIVKELKNDQYAIVDNGILTDLNELHQYQNRLENLDRINNEKTDAL